MRTAAFDTDMIPPSERLATFRGAATEFEVLPLGDPAAFRSRWRMLKLGDLNLIHSHTTPIRYRRDAAMIAADGEDRFTLHYYFAGGEAGTIDGRAVQVRAGEAAIWDLTRPLDVHSDEPLDAIIVTLPRYMIEEVLPAPTMVETLAPSPELNLAIDQALRLLDHAEKLPDGGATFYGRALRDMLAVAMLPAYRSVRPMTRVDAPLLQRMIDLIDQALADQPTVASIAAQLAIDEDRVTAVAEQFGGLPVLIERRRLLAAYRLLVDPEETASVSAIAHRSGFTSLPQFSRRFHTVFHTSARDLRRYGRGHLPGWAGAYHVERDYGRFLAPAAEAPRPA